jgi:hypothetical protein
MVGNIHVCGCKIYVLLRLTEESMLRGYVLPSSRISTTAPYDWEDRSIPQYQGFFRCSSFPEI